MSDRLKLIGETFGRLRVIEYAGVNNQRTLWLCECSCGNRTVVSSKLLKAGKTKSCGCLYQEHIQRGPVKHGYSRTPTYASWKTMRRRCNDENFISYPYYGARGIKVCKRWDDYKLFLADMGERPKGMTLDRIDPNKNYTPDNCRWATPKDQANNKRKRKKTLISYE